MNDICHVCFQISHRYRIVFCPFRLPPDLTYSSLAGSAHMFDTIKQEVKIGTATILCSTDGEVKEYDAEIRKIDLNHVDSISAGSILNKYMSYRTNDFSILDNRASAEPLYNPSCSFQKFFICHLYHKTFVGIFMIMKQKSDYCRNISDVFEK